MPFKSGKDWNGNRKGRPAKPEIEELRKALKTVKKEKKMSFLVSYVKRAYSDSPMAVALLKKLVPDLVEGDLGDNTKDILLKIVDFSKVSKE